MRRRTCGQSIHAIGEFADLTLQPLDWRRTHGRRGEQVADLLGLPTNALELVRVDRGLREAVDLPANRADLALKPSGDRLWVMRLQSRAQFGRHGVQRGEQRFALTAFAQHCDPLRQIADRALERDDRIARREVGETSRHRGDLDAHGVDLRGADARTGLFAPQVVEPADENPKFLDQRRRSRGRGGRLDSARPLVGPVGRTMARPRN